MGVHSVQGVEEEGRKESRQGQAMESLVVQAGDLDYNQATLRS